jgi:hypothetical protein
MRLFLIIILLFPLALSQNKIIRSTTSDLEILKFSWTKYENRSSMVNLEADPMPGPVHFPTPPRNNEPDIVRNTRDMNQRTMDLRRGEVQAARSGDKSTEHIYVYHIKFKNSGSKVVKSFIWQYQEAESLPDMPARQFLCEVKTKPNQTRDADVYSWFSPSRVVSVSARDSDPGQQVGARINRIDFEDGSTWEREGWDSAILTATDNPIPTNGKCFSH